LIPGYLPFDQVSCCWSRAPDAIVTFLQPTYPLETDRLLLRPFMARDFDALYAIHSRTDVARYLYWDARTEEEVRAVLGRNAASGAIESEGDSLTLAVVLKETNQLIGECNLHWLSREHRQGEIGFILHPDHQGRGYATEAGHVLLRIAFEDLKLHRVIGRLEARNAPSARVLQRLGMRREAHLVENEYVKGEWQSELVYAILDREWRPSMR
jgi:RimJ/RimL family protein N-acetyltransferase